MQSVSTQPTEIKNIKNREISITWNDGHVSPYPVALLRSNCPCATCNELRRNRDPLRVVQGNTPAEILALDVQIAGNYAINIKWSDGHNTGIYTFDSLRNMCPCDECSVASGR